MIRVESPDAPGAYLLKIRFKRWAKLWTPGNVQLHSPGQADRIEKRDHLIGTSLQRVPLPSLVKITVAKKRYGFKKRTAIARAIGAAVPTCFLLECYNPENHAVQLSLTIRSEDKQSRMPFQMRIDLTPGVHSIRVPFDQIAARVDVEHPFGIDIIPNDEVNETTLYFGMMEFVQEIKKAKTQSAEKDGDRDKDKGDKKSGDKKAGEKKVKCVVWDLDNTMWDGILVEDGIERLRLKDGIGDVIRSLDAKGILHSVASKNNADEAMQALKKFGLADYFLCPQISWKPKSESIKAIAQQLNIGIDTLLFIDDSKFELEEVSTVCPEVRVLNADQYRTLAERSEFQVPVTDESRERRKLYQVEMSRQAVAQDFSDDYMEFLRHCQIQLKMRPMTEENLERVHELTQRTNQMNFSGNRYDREVLRSLLSMPHLDTYVLSCEDRFGSYGVVGFSIVDRREPRMTDLMFSCRVQSKRVEHAFMTYVIRKYIAETGHDFWANYRKTPRNAPSGQVFEDVGMEGAESNPSKDNDGVLSLRFRKEMEVPDDGVIDVVFIPETTIVSEINSRPKQVVAEV
ncbi:MAG TPA: HAD-IIIC family phosphatase [Terriglobales bacterium]|nr:HAD-IIIC family phosphatase [Terriglobales bacterium]